MAKTVAFTDRLYRNVNAADLGRRTLRSLKVGDYIRATSSHAGKTDYFRVTKIGDLEPAHYSRGTYRRVQIETVAYGWDEKGAYRPAPRFESVIIFSSGDDVHIRRPFMSAAIADWN